jgi:hypothetical protein
MGMWYREFVRRFSLDLPFGFSLQCVSIQSNNEVDSMNDMLEVAKVVEAGIIPLSVTFSSAIKWAKSKRSKKKSEDFEKHVGALYTEFEPLGRDVIALFRSARNCLDGTKKEQQAAAKVIQAQRDASAESRHKMCARAEKYASSVSPKDEKLAGFVMSLASFFADGGSSFYSGGMAMSAPASLAARLGKRVSLADARKAEAEFERKQLLAYINRTITELEKSWYEISGRYEELRREYGAS